MVFELCLCGCKNGFNSRCNPYWFYRSSGYPGGQILSKIRAPIVLQITLSQNHWNNWNSQRRKIERSCFFSQAKTNKWEQCLTPQWVLATWGTASAWLYPCCAEHMRFIMSVGWPKAQLSWVTRRKIQLILNHGITWGSNERNFPFMCFRLNLGSHKNALKLDVTLSPDHGHDFPNPKAFMSCSFHWQGNRVLLLLASVFKILQ